MKADKYQRRFYREWVGIKDTYVAHLTVRETDLLILADKAIDEGFVRDKIYFYRRGIEGYISKDKRFSASLKPIEVELVAPPIVREMSHAARLANVGPMAAVAGAIAYFLGRDLLRRGYKDVIIENGGDIFLKTSRPCKVAIYAGKSKAWGKALILKIKPEETPMGICASSGTVGHSLSFGLADTAVILSKNAALADAVATAVANRVRSRQDFKQAVDFAKSIKGVVGGIIILKNHLACWGSVEFAD